MKKRIISLILVVAMSFLTLTGCAYNYAKDDVSKYATLELDEFYTALQALNITDADFGTDEEQRQVKVQDAIAQAILKVTDTKDKKYDGKLNKYDALYFVYYAKDVDSLKPDNIFFASKMNETSLTNIQLGLSTLEGLNKAISEAILALEGDITNHIYTSSSASVVGDKDVVSVSYTKLDKDGKELAKVSNEYFVVSTGEASETKEFAKALIGKKVGETLGEFKVTETVGEAKEAIEYTYKNVKVESIVKDNSTQTVEDGDIVNVTYTITFDAKPWYNEETGKYDFSDDLKYLETKVNAEGKYTVTYTNAFVTAKADPTVAEGATDEEKAAAEAAKTFAGQLIGKGVSTTATSTFKLNEEHDGKLVEVEYTGVKVNWIVNSDMNPIEVKYTPYEKNEDGTTANGKTNSETAVNGEKVVLDGEELTYYVFPVYYLDVEELSAELIVREFYSVLTETKAHDEAEEEHEADEEHEHEKLFSVLGYKNGDKTLETLVSELSTLASTLSTKESSLSSALTSLTTAQSNYAKITDTTAESEVASLKTKLDTAYTSYKTAKEAVDKAQADVDAKIAEILACKDGETAVDAALVADYKDYQYYTLENTYKSAINKSIVTEIVNYLNKNVKFTDNLPKKAVKEAYNSIMNAYKYDFYEGYYTDSSSSSSSSTTKVTNYKKYNGDFDAYLMAVTKTSDFKSAKAAVKTAAEESVKDVIIIYVLTNAVEAKWDTELSITREENKNIKKNIEAQDAAWKSYESLYQMYGMSYSDVVPSYSDAYHSSQFDKVMNYLLERKATEGNQIVYEHINYTIGAVEK